MNRTWLIAYRDWMSILLSPAGLGIVAIYLVIAGYVFASDVTSQQEASLRYTFANLGMLMLLMVPLLTMRLFSEEFRSGNFEVLVTQPITDTQLVMGKFLAGWLAYMTLTLPTLSYLFILEILGSPDWWLSINGFLGIWLLGMMLTALGLLFSATTDNSLLAALGAITVGMLLSSANEALYVLFGWPGEAIAYLSPMYHFGLFRRGILDSRSLAYFMFTTLVLLFITIRIIESRRWKFGMTPGMSKIQWRSPKRSLAVVVLAIFSIGEAIISRLTASYWSAYALFMVVMGLLLLIAVSWYNFPRIRSEIKRRQTSIAITVTFNCLLALIVWSMAVYLSSRLYTRIDMTHTQRYTLAPLSQQVVSQIQQPIDIYVAIKEPTDLVQQIRDLVDEYAALNNQLNVQFLDPQQSPEQAEQIRAQFNLNRPLSDEILVTNHDQYRRIPRTALYYTTVLRGMDEQRILAPLYFIGEAEITSTLIQLTRDEPGRIVFLSGHGERNPERTGDDDVSTWIQELNRQYWQVQHMIVTPGGTPQFPADTKVVVVAGPRRELTSNELQALNRVLDQGGGVLFLLDPGIESGIEPLIYAWNFRIGNDLVVDTESHTANSGPASIFVNRFSSNHPIGVAMDNHSVVLHTARRVAVTSVDPNPNISTQSLMHTSGSGWAVEYSASQNFRIDPSRDRRGPISLGMVAERYQPYAEPGQDPLQGRMIVIGDSDFVSNRYIDMTGNLDLAMNCIEWLAGRHDLLSIYPKTFSSPKLVLTAQQAKFTYWWSVLLLPVLAASAGLVLMMRRRWSA